MIVAIVLCGTVILKNLNVWHLLFTFLTVLSPLFVGFVIAWLLRPLVIKLSQKRGEIMVSYEPLWATMKRKNITTYTLIAKHDINPRTINNLRHNKSITMYTLERLCEILECEPNDIVKFVKE